MLNSAEQEIQTSYKYQSSQNQWHFHIFRLKTIKLVIYPAHFNIYEQDKVHVQPEKSFITLKDRISLKIFLLLFFSSLSAI